MDLAGQGTAQIRAQRGYAMAALLVGLSVMAVLMGMALPVWSQLTKREKEEELIWRGKQYARAVGLFQRKYANTFPPTLDVLVDQKFLRKKYKDPITNGDFLLIPAGGNPAAAGAPNLQLPSRGGPTAPTTNQPPSPTGTVLPFQPAGQGGAPAGGAPNLGIAGVVSKSKDSSIKIYNGRQKYNEWAFVYLQTARGISPGGGQGGFPGQQGPGGRGGPGANNPNAPPFGAPGGGFGTPGPGGGRGFGPPGGRGFENPNQSNRPPSPFGQPMQPMQPTQPPPFGQSPFGAPGGQPPRRPPGV